MNVSEVMTKAPRAVRVIDRLDEAARVLWEGDCGFVPVVDGGDVLVGVLTDRDLCMASFTQGKALRDLPVVAVMARELTTCAPDDALATAMQAMQQTRVHRLPVVDADGVLVGVLSTNDLLQAQLARPAAVPPTDVLATLCAVTAPRAGARDFGDGGDGAAMRPARKAAPKAKAKQQPTRKAAASRPAASGASAKKAAAKKAGARKGRA